jgi:hypothetical protein
MGRHAGAGVEANRDHPRRAAAGQVDHLVAVQRADVQGFARHHGGALQVGLHHARNARAFQEGLAEPQHPWQQPVVLAVGRGVAVVHQAQQVASCGGAGQAGEPTGFRGGEAGPVVGEGFDHAKALAQALDQQPAVDGRHGLALHGRAGCGGGLGWRR